MAEFDQSKLYYFAMYLFAERIIWISASNKLIGCQSKIDWLSDLSITFNPLRIRENGSSYYTYIMILSLFDNQYFPFDDTNRHKMQVPWCKYKSCSTTEAYREFNLDQNVRTNQLQSSIPVTVKRQGNVRLQLVLTFWSG